MRSWRRAETFITLAAFLIVGAVVTTVSAVGVMATGKPPLRIAFNAWPGYEFFSMAKELGYFEDEGVEVKLIHLGSLGDTRRMFERRQADLFASSMAEVIYVASENPESIKTIAIADYSMGADVLLARRETGSVQDLRGKRIGVEPHSLDVVNLAFALQTANLSLSDVVMVPMSQPEMPQAFAEGRIDAVQTYAPVSSALLRNPDVHRIFDTSQIPGAVVDCVSASPSTLRDRRADVAKVMRAFFRAQRFLKEHPDRAMPMLSRYLQVSPTEVEESLQGIGLISLGEQASELSPSGKFVRSLTVATQQLRSAGLQTQFNNWPACIDDSIVREINAK